MGLSDSPPTLEASHEQVSSLASHSGDSFEHSHTPHAQPVAYNAIHPSRLKSLPTPQPDHPDAEKLKAPGFDLPPPAFGDPMIYPSTEEFATLRKVPGKIFLNTYLIAFVEFAERFSYYGTTVVFTNFIQRPLPPGSTTGAGGLQAGALGLGQQAATGSQRAYVADAHLGRYNTIIISIFIALIGHTLLVISAIPTVIVHPSGSTACFLVAIIVFLPDDCLSQLALTGQIGMVYAEKYVGFWLAYLLPTVLFCTCPLVMILGKPLYVLRPPTGSVFGKALKLMKFATIKKFQASRKSPQQPIGFWEAVSHQTSPDRNPLDELRRPWNNNLTSQAAVMDTQGLPNDIISNLDPFALIILIPICDLLIYPALRRAGINFSPIKRITAGFITGALAMGWAAIIQHWIYQRSTCGNMAGSTSCPPVDINVWVQTPSYILIAFSEILASVTGLESAIASALGEAFVPLSADPLLVTQRLGRPNKRKK
ncbi:hypothetical protein KEM48_003215 [Puccinia striiformis f. sp. tritici PST-130]|nr:hypothetical protein KEM48_003215 [Puccinia striiformis f. sp. tritici PST-130]